MDRRKFGKSIATIGAMLSGSSLFAQTEKVNPIKFSVSMTKNNVKLYTDAVDKPSKIMFKLASLIALKSIKFSR